MTDRTEYKFYENFQITSDQMTGTITYSNGTGGVNLLNAVQSFDPRIQNNTPLTTFNISINAPKPNCNKIEIKNINASITNTTGYLFEIRLNNLFRYPVQFLDSQSALVSYEQYITGNLPSVVNCSISRISGTAGSGGNIPVGQIFTSSGTFADNSTDISGYLSYPSISFSLIYYYY